MRIAWFVPFALLGLAACSINTAPPQAAVAPPAATVVTPAPAATVVTPVPGAVVTTP
jgi:hypothetical protein